MAELGMGGSSGGGAGSASGQGAIQAKVGALQSALQSLKIVINNLREEGIGSGLIFEALSQKIGQLLQAQKGLTTELEQQKIKFKDNAEQLKVYTSLQGQLQTNIDGTVGAIKSLTKEQIDNSRRAQKASNETALKEQDAANQKKQRELSLEDVVIARYKREQALNEKVRLAFEEAEKQKAQIAKLNADEIEKREVDKFKRIVAAQKQEEAESKRASKAKIEADLKAIRSGKGSAKERLDAEIKYLQEVQKKYKEGSAEFEKMQGRISEAQGKSREASFRGGFLKSLQGPGLGRALGSLTGIGSVVAVLRGAFKGLQKVITESFKAAVNFEAQLAQLQAVTGVSNDELNQLSKSVLSVAGSTTFTSEEIVMLQTELGKLGFSSQQIVAATEGIARTAQALGESVGPVAQKVGQILKQYNLDASETEKVSDILVSTINSSALSFEGLGTAIQYVGPLAATAGTEFKDTAAAMAILADNGFTASRIGTGLRGILTELSKTGKDLNTVIRDLSDQEISFSNAIDLVGKRNAAQLISLVENIDALEDSENKYYQVGSAAIASAQQIDTFKGNVELLQSAFNKLQIEFGNTIKNSGLVRFVLSLIDEEGGKAAEAARQLSQVNLTDFSASLGEAANSLLELGSFSDRDVLIKASDIIEKDLFETLKAERTKISTELDAMFADLNKRDPGFGGYNAFNFDNTNFFGKRESSIITDEEFERIKELKNRMSDISGIVTNTFATSDLTDSINATKELLLEAIEQAKIEKERTQIQEEYSDLLESERTLRDDNLSIQLKDLKSQIASTKNLEKRIELEKKLEELNESRIDTLAEGIDFNLRQEKEVEKLNVRIKEEKEKLVDLDGEAYVLAQARVKQLEQEKKNFNNLIFSRDDLFKLAQKEYELEFKALTNNIDLEKENLKTREDEIKLRIKTLDNQLKSTTDAEKETEIIAQQVALRNELLVVQDKSRITIQGYLDEVNAKLEKQRVLWESQGYDLRLLDKAAERLTQFQLINDKLAIDFPEFKAAAEGLATTFNAEFGKTLSKGIPLTDAQKDRVKKSLTDLYTKFGISEENLSPSQKKLLEDYLLSTLEVDPDKVSDKTQKLLELALSELTDAAKAYNATALENTQNRLNQELDAVRNRYKTEEEILKSQLNNKLITESQFRAKSEELRKKQIQEENEIQKKIFDAQKKNDLINIGIETAEAVASNLLKNFGTAPTPQAAIQTAIGNAIIIAGGAAKADAVKRRKFFPATFEEGGFVQGPSHSEGGVPFTVQGQGGYEMEGGEFIVNKKAAAFHRSLLERINGSVKPNTSVTPLSFAEGGLIAAARTAEVNVVTDSKESVNLLKAIAHATISTATDMKKPTRAFITSKDLSQSETERRLKERNDRI
jgi:hypothetical protein